MKLPAIHSNAKNQRIDCPPSILAAQKFFLHLNASTSLSVESSTSLGLNKTTRGLRHSSVERRGDAKTGRLFSPPHRTTLNHASSITHIAQILSLASQWFGKAPKYSHTHLKSSQRCYSLSIGLGFAPKQKNEPQAHQRQGQSKSKLP
jgi:hypothetical protein